MQGIETTRTRDALAGERLARADRERDLRAGGDDHGAPRGACGQSAEHVAAAADRRDLRRVALLERHVLAREQQAGRAVGALDRARPGDGGLDRVAGTPDVHVRDQAQARGVLDRLVRRSVLAEADRIVRVDEDRAQLHQRRHAQRVARVVGEGEEGADVGNEAAVQREAVGDRAHGELAHAEVDVVAGLRRRSTVSAARPVGEDRAGEIGRAADQLRQRRRERFERLLRGLARGDRLAPSRAAARRARPRARRSRRAARPACAARTPRRARDAPPRTRRSARSSRLRARAPRSRASQPS